jgi:hypothetical protein
LEGQKRRCLESGTVFTYRLNVNTKNMKAVLIITGVLMLSISSFAATSAKQNKQQVSVSSNVSTPVQSIVALSFAPKNAIVKFTEASKYQITPATLENGVSLRKKKETKWWV